MKIYQAQSEEDQILAQHFYQLWLDNGITPESIDPSWRKLTIEFIEQARHKLNFQAFIAQVDGKVVGSASCQLFSGLYPLLFKQEYRHYGYIWNVYVETDFRRQGLATKLTRTAINHLKKLNCTKAILHASPSGRPIYESIGFIPNNEMILDLTVS